VEGIDLVKGDLNVTRYVDVEGVGKGLEAAAKEGGVSKDAKYEHNTDNDVVILLDCLLQRDLEDEGLARGIINRVQRMRKMANLKPTDDIDVFYRAEGDGAGKAKVETVMKEQEDLIKKVLRLVPQPLGDDEKAGTVKGKKVLYKEEHDIGEEKVKVTFWLVKA